jgi:SAM-dependent methyltransferase
MNRVLSKAGFDTDKSSNYLRNYEKFFSHLESKKINLLELGIYKGGSLLMWSRYFKRGNVVGVDINEIDLKLPQNAYVEIGDQRDAKFLDGVSEKYTDEGFDIIIDDASHYGNFTEASFLICFDRLLKSGGIYVIEDWGTGYWEDWPDGKKFNPSGKHIINKLRKPYECTKKYRYPEKIHYEGHDIGMVGLVKQFIDEVAIEDIKHSNPNIQKYSTDFEGVFYANGQVFIFKK